MLAIKKIDKKKKAKLYLQLLKNRTYHFEAVEENREPCRKRDANSIAASKDNEEEEDNGTTKTTTVAHILSRRYNRNVIETNE